MGAVRLYGSTSGYLELQAPAVAPDAVLTLPSDSVQPGLVHLHTESFSAVSNVNIDNVLSANYDAYRITFDFASSVITPVRLRYRVSGSVIDTSSYFQAGQYATHTGTTGNWAQAGANKINLGNTPSGSARFQGDLCLFNKQGGIRKTVLGATFGHNATGSEFQGTQISATSTDSTDFDGVSIYVDSGTATGSLRIYGYRNS